MRRSVDIAICLLIAPVVLLAGTLVAACVFLDSPGPVLYRSRRVGRGGRAFSMLKFRTMRHGVDGPSLSCARDARFTPFGRALALSRVDELPQIINVLRGDMRLVGPRPELQEFVDAYPGAYAEILTAAPGLTGPAQLRFSGGEGRILAGADDRVTLYRNSILPQKVDIDIAYVRDISLRRDLELLFWTALLPARLVGDAFRAWRTARYGLRVDSRSRPLVMLVAASIAVMLVFSVNVTTGL